MQTFLVVHVLISVVALIAGFVVLCGLLTGRRLDRWTAVFLVTTVLTSLTGFGFPFHGVTPAFVTGILSMIVLPVAIYARYPRRMRGGRRTVYVVTAVTAFWLNVVALIAQAFIHVPALHRLAPTPNDPPFAIAQAAAMLTFVVLGILAVRRFRAVN